MKYPRTSHAVYEVKSHLVWVPKYRKVVLSESVARRCKALFQGIAERDGLTVVEQEVMPEHVHVCVSAPPRWSPAELVRVLKSVSAQQLFKEFPPLRARMWGGARWSSGDCVRATGDAVTSAVIQRYLRYQRRHEDDCPLAHRVKVRTTHAIERAFRAVRRRTNVFSCFSNTASTERIIYAILTHLNHGWKATPLKGFTQFELRYPVFRSF